MSVAVVGVLMELGMAVDAFAKPGGVITKNSDARMVIGPAGRIAGIAFGAGTT